MTDIPRTINGQFKKPDGTAYALKTVTWYRAQRRAVAQGGSVIVDELFSSNINGSGQVTVSLVPGYYLARIALQDGDRFFELAVPEGTGTLVLADLIDSAAPPVTAVEVEQARQARDEALVHAQTAAAERLGAEEARDKAELWADEDEDVPVETGPNRFSAKHWSAKAEEAAASVGSPAPSSRQINTNNGLTGGGDLTADRTLGLTGQALAVHNLGTNGLVARTGAGTVASRLVAPGTGIAVTNGDGVAGNPTVAADIASQAEAQAGTSNTKLMTPLRVADALAAQAVHYQEFLASGTWNKPAGVRFVYVELIGGGGAGAAIGRTQLGAGGGGGGEPVSALLRASDLGSAETVTIGAGGTAATASGDAAANSGGDGGDTTFGTHLTARGGKGGTGGSLPTGGQAGSGEAGAAVMETSRNAANEAGTTYLYAARPVGALAGAGGMCTVQRTTVYDLAGASCRDGGAGGGGARSQTGSLGTSAGGVSNRGGNGGAGAAGNSVTATSGVQPGGGGGAVARNTSGTCTSGAGAAGRLRIWAW